MAAAGTAAVVLPQATLAVAVARLEFSCLSLAAETRVTCASVITPSVTSPTENKQLTARAVTEAKATAGRQALASL